MPPHPDWLDASGTSIFDDDDTMTDRRAMRCVISSLEIFLRNFQIDTDRLPPSLPPLPGAATDEPAIIEGRGEGGQTETNKKPKEGNGCGGRN